MIIGYIRVSTQDQNLDLQRAALEQAGVEKIYEDTASGKNMDRDGLKRALDNLRSGDVFVVWKLDRLGRTVKGLVDLVQDLSSRGVHFKSITDSIDTSTPAGRFFFHVMASLAQMERELIAERTQAGIAEAKRRGKRAGRKFKMTPGKVDVAKRLLKDGTNPSQVAETLDISLATLYRHVHPAEFLRY